MNYFRSNNLSFKYQNWTPSGYKDVHIFINIYMGLEKIEFVTKSQNMRWQAKPPLPLYPPWTGSSLTKKKFKMWCPKVWWKLILRFNFPSLSFYKLIIKLQNIFLIYILQINSFSIFSNEINRLLSFSYFISESYAGRFCHKY